MGDYKIKIKGQLISVNKDIYIAYYKMARRERYLEEVSFKKELSYNHLIDKEYPIEMKMSKKQKLVEDEVIKKIMIEKMIKAIENLTDSERVIIKELFWYEKSERELANLMNIPRTTLHSKKMNIINKLKKLFEIKKIDQALISSA